MLFHWIPAVEIVRIKVLANLIELSKHKHSDRLIC